MEWKLNHRQSRPRTLGLAQHASSMKGEVGHKNRKFHRSFQENWLYLEQSVGKFKPKVILKNNADFGCNKSGGGWWLNKSNKLTHIPARSFNRETMKELKKSTPGVKTGAKG